MSDEEDYLSNEEDEGGDTEDEEESSASPQQSRGTFLPNCCQKQSCGSCETTQTAHAPLKTNYALSKNALMMDLRKSDVSL